MSKLASPLFSKVGIRITVLFAACAFLPLLCVSILCFGALRGELDRQSKRQRFETSKAFGLSLFDRLKVFAGDLEHFALRAKAPRQAPKSFAPGSEGSVSYFDRLYRIESDGQIEQLAGDPAILPEDVVRRAATIDPGRKGLVTTPASSRLQRVFLLAATEAESSRSVVVGEVSPSHLWSLWQETCPSPDSHLVVLDQDHRLVTSTLPDSELPCFLARLDLRAQNTRDVAVGLGANEYLEGHWSLFLKGLFDAPDWEITFLENVTQASASSTHFLRSFLLVILFCFLAILYLSQFQIRKTLGPLQSLKDGTLRVAAGDLTSRVTVGNARDEFSELAMSFNGMAEQIQLQFQTLGTLNSIVQSVLSRLKPSEIIGDFLLRAPPLFPGARISVLVLNHGQKDRGVLYHAPEATGPRARVDVRVSNEDLRGLHEALEASAGPGAAQFAPTYLARVPQTVGNDCTVIPLSVNGALRGSLNFSFDGAGLEQAKLRSQARFLADQMAVALSNANMLIELEHLGIGAMTAFARTVDAKSRWTAGHSERVAMFSVAMAEIMGMPESEVELIRRGCLLHDVGKIGIPNEILDKPGRLTPEEFETMKRHPELGARILEPLPPFQELIPMVLHHHERLDGKGYPMGISGEAIDMRIRIVTVADVFDALTSDRPYRVGMLIPEALEIIRKGIGAQFDSRPVAALEKFMEGDLSANRDGLDAPVSEQFPVVKSLEIEHAGVR